MIHDEDIPSLDCLQYMDQKSLVDMRAQSDSNDQQIVDC